MRPIGWGLLIAFGLGAVAAMFGRHPAGDNEEIDKARRSSGVNFPGIAHDDLPSGTARYNRHR